MGDIINYSIYEDGYLAAYQKKSISGNPYEEGSNNAKEWTEGYIDGRAFIQRVETNRKKWNKIKENGKED